MKMLKLGWFIPALIVAVNALAILIRWHSLPESLPAHFDLQGNASGTMSRSTLLIYPAIGAAVCIIAYVLCRQMNKQLQQLGLIILTSGIVLTILSSTLVTLTTGTMPVFMLAEPVILGIALVSFLLCLIKARKQIE